MYIAELYRNGLVAGLSDNGFALVETLIDDWEDHKDDYLCDLVATVANDSVSIYFHDLYDFARENPDALEEVIEECTRMGYKNIHIQVNYDDDKGFCYYPEFGLATQCYGCSVWGRKILK